MPQHYIRSQCKELFEPCDVNDTYVKDGTQMPLSVQNSFKLLSAVSPRLISVVLIFVETG